MAQLDMGRISAALGAKRRGRVSATGGYFGAMQLLADVEARFRVPAGGGRPTDPKWTERRLVPLAPRTLKRLEAITAKVRERDGVNVEPMQLAALLLEKTTEQISEDEAKNLVRPRRRASFARLEASRYGVVQMASISLPRCSTESDSRADRSPRPPAPARRRTRRPACSTRAPRTSCRCEARG